MTVTEVTCPGTGSGSPRCSARSASWPDRAIDRFVDDVVALAQRANIVVVNLVAATVPAPEVLARALRRPGTMLSGPDKALLLVGADDRLLGALRRIGGEIATMPRTALTPA